MIDTDIIDMNNTLHDLKSFGCVGVKAEFEAEGTRDDELVWLLKVAASNNLPVTMKIGGCESVRDLQYIKKLNIEKVVAPMIESEFSLSKYLQAIKKVFPEKDRSFLFNIETVTGYNNAKKICSVAGESKYIDGIVFGRVDYTDSLNMSRDSVNTNKITKSVNRIGRLANKNNLDFLVGGNVSGSAYDELNKMNYIRNFETRKLIFKSSILNKISKIDFCILIEKCVKFELLWLKQKQQYYNNISTEDIARIKMLQSRISHNEN
jgi:hypothetical protein